MHELQPRMGEAEEMKMMRIRKRAEVLEESMANSSPLLLLLPPLLLFLQCCNLHGV